MFIATLKYLMMYNSISFQDNLKLGNKCQDAAAFLSAKYLTRPEIVSKYLPEFLDWALQIITKKSTDRMDDVTKMGALKSVAAIYKYGKREDLLKYASTVLKTIQVSLNFFYDILTFLCFKMQRPFMFSSDFFLF